MACCKTEKGALSVLCSILFYSVYIVLRIQGDNSMSKYYADMSEGKEFRDKIRE